MRQSKKEQQGFAALFTTIIISAVLFGVVVALHEKSFLLRMRVLGAEYKAQSYALAEGCVQVARLRLAANAFYAGGETMFIDTGTCRVLPVIVHETYAEIRAQATTSDAVTNLVAHIDPHTFAVIFRHEIASF